MLKTPQSNPIKPIQMVEDPSIKADMKALHDSLTNTDSKPNIITLDVFREFEPLFKKNNNLSRNEINELTKKYVTLIDFYKETQIVLSPVNMTVILTLPSIFTPVRSLEISEKNASVVAANQKLAHSNIPRYSFDVFAAMFNAVRDEQLNNIPVIKEYSERYKKIAQDFFLKYSNQKSDDSNNVNLLEKESSNATTDQGTEWDLE